MAAGGMSGLTGLQMQQQQRQRQQNQQQQQYQLQIQTLPRPPQQFSDTPQEFPLTRSVSTTTEIYATQNVSFGGGDLSEKASMAPNKMPSKDPKYNANQRRRSVATNTRFSSSGNSNNSDSETQTNVVGGGSGVGGKKFLQQQHQQQLENLYNKRQQQTYNAATSSGPRTGGKADHHSRNQTHHTAVHQSRLDSNDDNADDDDDHVDVDHENDPQNNDEDNDADEVHPQKLCGLRRGIRKTKDELFEEFCKRAGVRPKPKNIYYIENDDDDVNGDENQGDHDEDVANAATTINAGDGDVDSVGGMHANILRSKNNIRISGSSSNQRSMDGSRQQHHGKLSEFRVIGNGNSNKNRENNRLFAGEMDNHHRLRVASHVDDGGNGNGVDDDDDADMLDDGCGGRDDGEGDDDEHGFKKLTENEDHLYVIDGKWI